LDSFQKRERERKKLQHRRDKAERKRERAEHPLPIVGEASSMDPESKPEAERETRPEATKPDTRPA